jgi:hypothetical protein
LINEEKLRGREESEMGKEKIIVSYGKLRRKDLLQEKGNKKDIEFPCKDTPCLSVMEEVVRGRRRSLGISFYTEICVKRSSCFL